MTAENIGPIPRDVDGDLDQKELPSPTGDPEVDSDAYQKWLREQNMGMDQLDPIAS